MGAVSFRDVSKARYAVMVQGYPRVADTLGAVPRFAVVCNRPLPNFARAPGRVTKELFWRG
jgi:hypothetical protein